MNNFKKIAQISLENEYKRHEQLNSPKTERILTKDERNILIRAVSSLPLKIQFVLSAKYSYNLTPEQTEIMYDVKYARGIARFWTIFLSETLKFHENEVISSQDLDDVLTYVLDNDIHDVPLSPTPQKSNNILLFIAKRLVASLFIIFFGLTSAMLVSAEVREIVSNFFIETFDEHSIFINNSSSTSEYKVSDFTLSYIPDGYELTEYIEDEVDIFFRYENENQTDFAGTISIGNGVSSLDTEGATIEEFILNGNIAYRWTVMREINSKLTADNFIVFSVENISIHLYGTISSDELLKIAENIIY